MGLIGTSGEHEPRNIAFSRLCLGGVAAATGTATAPSLAAECSGALTAAP
jgi:hypothetical protein